VSETIMKLENVTKVFTLGIIGRVKIVAVDRVSMDVRKGEILGILGESGSGKSTIAKMILKIYMPTSGRILYRGKDIREFRGSKGLKEYYKQVQGVFQDPYASFNPRRRVLDVLRDAVKNYYGVPAEEADRIIRDAVERIGINFSDIVGKYPHEFSGGQLQRLSIARALLVKPEIIVADEPVSMVDASTRIDILNIFIDLKEKEGLTSIVIGHDLSLTHYTSDRVVVLYRGQIVEEGSAEILLNPAHPYTQMLAKAIPRVDKKWDSKIEYGVGSLELGAKGAGCVFADRCPYARDICRKQEPPYVDLGRSRVKCWLYAEKH